jgi:hypothetical protein
MHATSEPFDEIADLTSAVFNGDIQGASANSLFIYDIAPAG